MMSPNKVRPPMHLPKKINRIAKNIRMNPKRKKGKKKLKDKQNHNLGNQFQLMISVRDETDHLAVLNTPKKEHKFSNLNVFGADDSEVNHSKFFHKNQSEKDYSLKTIKNTDFSPKNSDLSHFNRNNIEIKGAGDQEYFHLKPGRRTQLRKNLRIDTSDNIEWNNLRCNSPSQSPSITNFQSDEKPSRVYYFKGKDDVKKKLFRMGSTQLRCQTPVAEDLEPQTGYLNIEKTPVAKNVVACKLPYTAHLGSRRRIRKESELTNEKEIAHSKYKNKKLNKILSTIVQKCDDVVEEEPTSAVFEGLEFNIIKEQFKANKRNYLSQLLQKYDDTPLESNNMLVKLIQELTTERLNDEKNTEQVVKEFKISQMPLKFIRTARSK